MAAVVASWMERVDDEICWCAFFIEVVAERPELVEFVLRSITPMVVEDL
jgi:hypothetical protein